MSITSAGASGSVGVVRLLDRVADRLARGAAAGVVGGRRVDRDDVVGRDLVGQRVGERVATGCGRRRSRGGGRGRRGGRPGRWRASAGPAARRSTASWPRRPAWPLSLLNTKPPMASSPVSSRSFFSLPPCGSGSTPRSSLTLATAMSRPSAARSDGERGGDGCLVGGGGAGLGQQRGGLLARLGALDGRERGSGSGRLGGAGAPLLEQRLGLVTRVGQRGSGLLHRLLPRRLQLGDDGVGDGLRELLHVVVRTVHQGLLAAERHA